MSSPNCRSTRSRRFARRFRESPTRRKHWADAVRWCSTRRFSCRRGSWRPFNERSRSSWRIAGSRDSASISPDRGRRTISRASRAMVRDDDEIDTEQLVLGDLLNHVLDKGVVIGGTVTISVADIDLLVLDLRLLLTSVETAMRHEIDRSTRDMLSHARNA